MRVSQIAFVVGRAGFAEDYVSGRYGEIVRHQPSLPEK
jgi:hypothetical protein